MKELPEKGWLFIFSVIIVLVVTQIL